MAKHSSKGYTFTVDATAVEGLIGLPWPDYEPERIEVTDLSSTYKEYVDGLPDESSTVEVNVVYDPDDAGQQAMIANKDINDSADAGSETTMACIITAPDDSTSETTPGDISFDAWCKRWTVSGGVNARAEATFTLVVTAEPTYTDPTTV